MPFLAPQLVKLSSLAAALLLCVGLIIHLHLLGSKALPSTLPIITLSSEAAALPLGTAAADYAGKPARIEFGVAGLFLDLEDALNLGLPLQRREFHAEAALLRASPGSSYDGTSIRRANATQGKAQRKMKSRQIALFGRRKQTANKKGYSSGLRLLIAVTSECCSSTSKSARRRAEARRTWAKHIQEQHSAADIRFVLAQPHAKARAEAVLELTREARGSSDLLMIRGLEDYKNLPNKSLRLMRYALSSPSGYTHVLKTDDDCYIRYRALVATLQQPAVGSRRKPPPQMTSVYKGCLENPHGFYALRNEDSKWHIPYEDMPDWVVPWERKYLAGWGYLLSRDVAYYIVNATAHWDRAPDQAPGWYAGLHWEDVLVGLVASEFTGEEPQDDAAFVAAWKGCSAATAVRHLDVEAPALFQELYQKELRGEWKGEQVKCSEGDYAPDDYWSWKGWRDGLTGVQALGNVGRL